jgi:UDP-glucose 6-dehydrogenase
VHKMEGQMEVNHVQLAAKLGELDSKVSQVLQRDRMGVDFDMVFKTAGELGRNAPISALMDRLNERGIHVPADLLEPQQSLPGVSMAADAPVDASVSASQTTSPDSGDPVVAVDGPAGGSAAGLCRR